MNSKTINGNLVLVDMDENNVMQVVHGSIVDKDGNELEIGADGAVKVSQGALSPATIETKILTLVASTPINTDLELTTFTTQTEISQKYLLIFENNSSETELTIQLCNVLDSNLVKLNEATVTVAASEKRSIVVDGAIYAADNFGIIATNTTPITTESSLSVTVIKL